MLQIALVHHLFSLVSLLRTSAISFISIRHSNLIVKYECVRMQIVQTTICAFYSVRHHLFYEIEGRAWVEIEYVYILLVANVFSWLCAFISIFSSINRNDFLNDLATHIRDPYHSNSLCRMDTGKMEQMKMCACKHAWKGCYGWQQKTGKRTTQIKWNKVVGRRRRRWRRQENNKFMNTLFD